MEKEKKVTISAAQLFVLLFISRTIVNITYSLYIADTSQMWDNLISTVISFFLTLLMVVPVYLLYKRDKPHSILDQGYMAFKKFGAAIAILYALYFIWVLCYTLSLFDLFVTDLMNPKISSAVLSFGVIIASVYGAYKGIEALGRTSGLILIAVLAAFVFLVCALTPQIDPLNYKPLFYDGASGTVNGVLLMLARNSCIPALAILLPFAKGNVKKGIGWWCTAIYGSSALVIFLVVGVLGDYLSTQPFPVYSATSVAQIGVFQRMDAVFLGVWTAGIFIKCALFLYLVSLCVKKMWGEKAARISIIVTGAAVLLMTYGITASNALMSILFNNNVLLALTLITAVAVPLIVLFAGRKRRKRA